MAVELDVAYIKGLVEAVLCKTFPAGSEKRRVLVKERGIEMACPICGDSAKNPRAKRGFLFFGSLFFKCLNEECRSSLTGLCRDRDVQLDPDKKMAIFQYLDQQVASGAFTRSTGDEFIVDSLDKLLSMEELTDYFERRGGFLEAFRPVGKRDPQHAYLAGRGIPEEAIAEIYAARLPITPTWKEEVVVLLNRSSNGKVLGMQVRNLKSGDKRMFKIYNFEHLYNAVRDEDLDPIEAIPYNKLSYLFNILRVDFDRPITVFEGYLDALFYPNSIGAVGTETDFGFLTAEGVDVRFFFDNDGAGHWKSRKYMRKGFPVFLWHRLFEAVLRKAKGDPLRNERALKQLKDLNGLVNATPGHDPLRTYSLEAQFSSTDGLDLHWVPSPTKEDKQAFFDRKKRGSLGAASSLDEMRSALAAIH